MKLPFCPTNKVNGMQTISLAPTLYAITLTFAPWQLTPQPKLVANLA